MKKVSIILCAALILTLLFSACTMTKTPITTQEFTSKAKSLGFDVYDATEQMGGQTVASLVAISVAGNFQVEFHVLSDQAEASGAFSDNKINLDAIDSGSSVSASGNNWAYLGKTAGGAYYYISYIEDTFVYVRTAQENKQAVNNLMKKLGY